MRPGRPAGSDGTVTRERLLRSARDVFSASGYEKATPAAVAAGAGLGRTAFYRYSTPSSRATARSSRTRTTV